MSKFNRKSTNRKPVRKSGNPANRSEFSASEEQGAFPITAGQAWSVDLLNDAPMLTKALIPDDDIAAIHRAHGFPSSPSEETAAELRRFITPFMLGITPEIRAEDHNDVVAVVVDEREGSICVTAANAAVVDAWRNACDADRFNRRWGVFLTMLTRQGVPVPTAAFNTRLFDNGEFFDKLAAVTGR